MKPTRFWLLAILAAIMCNGAANASNALPAGPPPRDASSPNSKMPAPLDYNRLGKLDTSRLQADNGTTIVARVNGEGIPFSDFQADVKLALGSQFRDEHARSLMAALSTPVMDHLVQAAVVRQYAKSENLLPSDTELDAKIRSINAQLPAGHKVEDQAIDMGVTAKDIQRHIMDSLILTKVTKYIGDRATTGSPTEEELTNFLKSGKILTSVTVELRASHIVFRATSDMTTRSIEDNRLAAEDVLKKIHAGLDFAAAARDYSQDRFTAWKGGDVGYFIHGMMFPAFEKAAMALPIDGVSDVVRTPVGFHIIKVTERHQSNARMLYEQSRKNAAVEKTLSDLTRKARIEKFL